MAHDRTNVQVIEKPESISFDELFDIIYRSHENNRKLGLKINTKISSGEQLRESIEKDNMTVYVAICDGAPAGTLSVKLENGKHRFVKRKTVCYVAYVAVLPEYKGCGIGKALCDQAEDYARAHNADALGLYVADRNPALDFYRHLGFEGIEFLPRISLKQNAVYMVKWLKPCGVSEWKRNLYYRARESYVNLKYGYNK